MLKFYTSNNYDAIPPNTPNCLIPVSREIKRVKAMWAKRFISGRYVFSTYDPGCVTIPCRTYATTPRRQSKPQSARGRIRAALAAMFPQFGHCTITAIVNRVMACARHIKIDRDNPATHIAFSPDGVSANDFKRRRSLTLAKFLRRKCGGLFVGRLALSDQQVDKASAAYLPPNELQDILKIVRGADAHAVYADDENGISSCMSGTDEDDDGGEYDKSNNVKHHFRANPEKLGLVVAYDGEKLVLRAKIWHRDDDKKNPGKRIWLDRVYWRQRNRIVSIGSERGEELPLAEVVSTWLKNQGFELADSCRSTLRHDQGEPFPYLDRCKRFDRDGDNVTVHSNGRYTAENTNGTDDSLEEEGCCCYACDERIDEDNSQCDQDGNTYCGGCYSELFCYDDISGEDIDRDSACEATRINRRGHCETVTTHEDNCTELYDGSYGIDEDTVELTNGSHAMRDDDNIVCLRNEDYAHFDDCVRCEVGSSADEYELTGDCIQTIDGEWCLQCDAVKSDISGCWMLADDAIELPDGRYAHETELVELEDGSSADPRDVTILVDGRILLSTDCVILADGSSWPQSETITVTDDYGNTVYLAAEVAEVN